MVLFKPLGTAELAKIVDLQVNELRERLAQQRIDLELTHEARHLIAERGYDPVFGARPLRRYISHDIETRIGRALLADNVQQGQTVRIDAQHGELLVTYREPPRQKRPAA